MRLRKELGRAERLTIDELMASGTVVVAAPAPCATISRAWRDETAAGKLVVMLQFGVLSDELTKRNMEMFAAEVMAGVAGVGGIKGVGKLIAPC